MIRTAAAVETRTGAAEADTRAAGEDERETRTGMAAEAAGWLGLHADVQKHTWTPLLSGNVPP